MSRLKIRTMALEPSLWGTLPKELLHLVFVHLPAVGIGQLRVLSKEWKRNVDCKDSEFNQVLDATAHPNMFALLSSTFFGRFEVSGNMYDVQADRWHVLEIDAIFEKVVTFDGGDGGLVCCVSERKWRNNKLEFFIVMNPLTKQKMQLPPLLSMGVEKTNILVIVVRMVKLTMDRKTKDYKVFVVGSIENGSRGFFAQVYDSHIKKWTVVEATQGHIIGWDDLGFDSDVPLHRSLCMYNYVDGTLQHFNETNIALRLKVESGCCVFIEDHLFVLHKEASPGPTNLLEDGVSMLQKYCISKFHLPEKTTTWVKLGVYNCGPCKCFHDRSDGTINSRLYGCNRFLLVYALVLCVLGYTICQHVSGATFQPL